MASWRTLYIALHAYESKGREKERVGASVRFAPIGRKKARTPTLISRKIGETDDHDDSENDLGLPARTPFIVSSGLTTSPFHDTKLKKKR